VASLQTSCASEVLTVSGMQGNAAWCQQQAVHAYLDQAAAAVFLPPALTADERSAAFSKMAQKSGLLDGQTCLALGAELTHNWGCAMQDLPEGQSFEESDEDSDAPPPEPTAEQAARMAAHFPLEKLSAAHAMFDAYKATRAAADASQAAYEREMTNVSDGGFAEADTRAQAAALRAAEEVKRLHYEGNEGAAAMEAMMQEANAKLRVASYDEAHKIATDLSDTSKSMPQFYAQQAKQQAAKAPAAPAQNAGQGGAGSAAEAPEQGDSCEPVPQDISDDAAENHDSDDAANNDEAEVEPEPGAWTQWVG
jgi:hypothetical protein